MFWNGKTGASGSAAGGLTISETSSAIGGQFWNGPGRRDIVNAVEKDLQFLFNRRTLGPPLCGAQLCFL